MSLKITLCFTIKEISEEQRINVDRKNIPLLLSDKEKIRTSTKKNKNKWPPFHLRGCKHKLSKNNTAAHLELKPEGCWKNAL